MVTAMAMAMAMAMGKQKIKLIIKSDSRYNPDERIGTTRNDTFLGLIELKKIKCVWSAQTSN